MDCNEFRRNWSEWHAGELDPARAGAMSGHIADCPPCRRYDRQMAAMVSALEVLPVPGAGPDEQQPPAPERRWPRWPVAQAAALAATLVLGVAIGVLIGRDGPAGAPSGDPVRLAGTGVHEVQLAFESPGAIRRVAFVVELPPGVEMVGYPDQRTVRWEGRLAEGRSRLRLPLRVTAPGADGTLVAHIERGSKRQTLRVPLEVAGGDGRARAGTARMG